MLNLPVLIKPWLAQLAYPLVRTWGYLADPVWIPAEPVAPEWQAEADPETLRTLYVDMRKIDDRLAGVDVLVYDFDEVTRRVEPEEMHLESDVSIAVRLIISEVGADRLLENRYGFDEAIGILYTVENRLDPLVYNVENQPRAPVFEGCGVRGSYGTCANPEQYLGMATRRAIEPLTRYDADLLGAAVDRAVFAWWLVDQGLVADPTGGATNYVHRCGGAAYGRPTRYCDAHVGNSRRDDIRGANPFTGPLVFKAPAVYSRRSGVYTLYESLHVDYAPRPSSGSTFNDGIAALDDDLSIGAWR